MKTASLLLYALIAVFPLWTDAQEARAQSKGLVIESHVGERARDANFLLAPLLDELKNNGFAGGSVTGTRIHSKHSISSEQLTQKQIDSAKRDVKDAHAAFIDFKFEGAVETGTRALALLMSRPATMARQQQVREHLYDVLIVMSMANSRLGNDKALQDTMGEFIRSFPSREVSVKKYGPEGAELFRQINKRMSTQARGQLQIAASAGSMIFVNEKYVGIGSLKVDLYPGQYRIYTQNGPRKGRVNIARVRAKTTQTLIVDEVVDKSLRSTDDFVGLVFEDDAQRNKEERRVTMQLGAAIGAQTIVLVGIRKNKGRDAIEASALSIDTGEIGLSARVPVPREGAPSIDQLRALAAFVSGSEPASRGIEVFTVDNSAGQALGNKGSEGGLVLDSEATFSNNEDTQLSSGWRWTSWGLGLISMGVGGYLISIDGERNCDLPRCRSSYDTLLPGAGLLGTGSALGILGFYLWTKERPSASTSISLMPAQGGWAATVRTRF